METLSSTIIHIASNPRVVARRPFFRYWHGALQLSEYLVPPRPHMTSGWTESEARPALEVVLVFSCRGALQTPHDHVVVGVVPRVPDGHVLKYLDIKPQNIVRLGPHLPPLSHHHPFSPIYVT